ncbi:hypothetical protein [Paraglaciecola sp. 2405UD69-4]|uniref:hypothetical protein n=1 Tax=Paraglaciecola sp. 2405UD69-4 TaxID=3391836 RepID=UPI0039C904DC
MKITIKCLLIMLTLLTSQVSKAYEAVPSAEHCDMQMQSHVQQGSEQMDMSSMMDNHRSGDSSSAMEKMECCDNSDSEMAISNICNDGQCGCESLVGSIVILISPFESMELHSVSIPIAYFPQYLPSPSIDQVKRPPIF